MADIYEPAGQQESKPIIRAFIVNTDAMITDMAWPRIGDLQGAWHDFPTTPEAMQATLREIGAEGAERTKCLVRNFETDVPGLFNCLYMGAGIDELNLLASKLAGMAEDGREVFGAALLANRHNTSIMDMINLTENLHLFDIQPAFTLGSYGEFLYIMGKDEYAGGIERLEKSSDPDMRGLAAYIERLERYFNHKAYALDAVKAENGVFTHNGYLTESEGFKEVYASVPPEYRVFAPPERDPQERPSAMEKLAAAKETVKANDASKPATPPKSHEAEL